MRTDHIDLWQMHYLVQPDEWEVAFGPGGVLEAFVEAKEQGLVRFLGVTGHDTAIPVMHKRSLMRFDFDSVLLPYNYAMMQNPQYAADFQILDEHLLPVFLELDAEALRAQNDFRMEQLILIGGGLVATVLGALHMAFGLGTAADAGTGLPVTGAWAWAGAVVSAVVATVTARARDLRNQDVYRTSRLKAELLRGEFYLFLGRVGDYGKPARVGSLVRRVAEIQSGSESDE